MGREHRIRRAIRWALGLSAVFVAGVAISQGARRIAVQCGAEELADRTAFLCRVIDSSQADAFKPDAHGGVIDLKNGSFGDSTIEVTHSQVGPSGRGGARRVNGAVEVVDGAGRVTHRDFAPIDTKPFTPMASSIAVLGDAGDSPINMSLVAPVEGVSSGRALFLGDAKNISIDVSGRDGADGRSAGVSAALQILRGELGASEAVKGLADRMALGPGVSEPSISATDLADSAGRCEAIASGRYQTPERSEDGLTLVARTERAREVLVSRSVCERQTSQEFSIQTLCARPPEVKASLRCEYPSLVRRSPIWRRPIENKKVEMTCANSVPEGQWDVECGEEKFAVAGSVLRPEWVTLAPSDHIATAMRSTLFHQDHGPTNKPECGISPSQSSGGSPVYARDMDYTTYVNSFQSQVLDLVSQARVFPPQGQPQQLNIMKFTSTAMNGFKLTFDQQTGLGTTEIKRSPSGDSDLVLDITCRAGSGTSASTFFCSAEEGDSLYDITVKPNGDKYDIRIDVRWVDDAGEFRTASLNPEFSDANPPLGGDCRAAPYHKMDKLRMTGALVKRYDRNAMPGTNEERQEGANAAKDITRLTYWADRGSEGNDSLPREKYDDLAPGREIPALWNQIDPAAAPTSAERDQRQAYLNGLVALGFDAPSTIDNATIAFKSLKAKRHRYGTTDAPSMAAIVCDVAPDWPLDGSGRPIEKTEQACRNYLKAKKYDAGKIAAKTRYREALVYTFEDLRAGLMIRRPGVEGVSPNHYLRSITSESVSMPPRVIYIPGDMEIEPITKISYCSEIQVDNDPLLINSQDPNDFIGPELASGATFSTYAIAEHASRTVKNQSTEAMNYKAPSMSIYPYANSFMKVRSLALRAQNGNCGPVQVTHDKTAHESRVIRKLRNSNGVVITAKDNQIIVYFSPVKTPRTSKLFYNPGIAPGLYLPLVNVAPMWLDAPGHHAADIWAGYGIPSRVGLGTSDSGGNPWEKRAPGSSPVSLLAKFDESINYYAIPRNFGTPRPEDDKSYPERAFVAAGTRNIEGQVASEDDAREPRGTPSRDKPRFIKTLRSLHLGVKPNDPQASTTTVQKTNVRGWGDVLLTKSIGGMSNANKIPTGECLAPGLAATLKWPTKLISRRAEKMTTQYPYEDLDVNVVADPEVSDGTGTRNWPEKRHSLFFTRPYLPTTMKWQENNEPLFLDEPINLAQDYNSYLAQLQTNSYLTRQDNGALTWRSNELTLYRMDYAANNSRKEVVKRLTEIGKRAPKMATFAEVVGSGSSPAGRAPLNSEEADCINSNGDHNSGQPFCFQYDKSDTFRANRAPFLVTEGFNAITWPYDSSGTIRIGYSRGGLWRGVRPWDQYARGGSDWRHNNHNCEGDGRSRWPNREDSHGCYTSYNFHAGHFFPFLRTKLWMFYGPKTGSGNTNTDFLPNGGSYPLNGDRKATFETLPLMPAWQYIEDLDGLAVGGANDDRGGAGFNPTSFYIPPYGVSGVRLSFGRFLSSFVDNCDQIKRDEISRDDYCADPPEEHKHEAAIHLFHGAKTGVNYFGSPDSADAMPAESPRRSHLDLAIYREPDLEWVGMSGFAFNECDDSLDYTVTHRTNATDGYGAGTHQVGFTSNQKGFLTGHFPLGLTLADDGGLYYGPLLGQKLQPAIGEESRTSVYNNLVLKSFDNRDEERVVIYAGGIANLLTNTSARYEDEEPASGRDSTEINLTRSNLDERGDELYQVTVGRAIQDAMEDLASAEDPTYLYNYEPPVALIPEVLAALFVHSDVGAGETTPLSDGRPMKPRTENEPRYFAHLFDNFLTSGASSEIGGGFIKNEFAVDDGYIRPMVFAWPRDPATIKKISFSWIWDDHSLHMTVIGLNAPPGTGLGESEGISSGVVVKYDGLLGPMTEELEFTRGGKVYNTIRNEGLARKEVRDTRLVLRESDPSETGGATLKFYVDVNEEATGPRPFRFAEVFCSDKRSDSIPKAYRFRLKTSDSGSDDREVEARAAEEFVSPYNIFCVAAATRHSGFGGYRRNAAGEFVDASNQVTTDPAAYTITIENGTIDPVNVDRNIYWEFVRTLTRKDPPITINGVPQPRNDPTRPPQCSANQVVISQNFNISGTVPTMVFKANRDWKAIDPLGNEITAKFPDSDNPLCPEDSPLEVGSLFRSLFANPDTCYNVRTGDSVPDTRRFPNRALKQCPNGGKAGIFYSTIVEAAPGDFVEAGSLQSSSFSPPGNAPEYNIFSGTMDLTTLDNGQPATVASIYPEALSKETDWERDDGAFAAPSCPLVYYYKDSGADASGDPGGPNTGVLAPKWSFLSMERRYGGLDRYVVKTTPKQALIPSGTGDSLSISQAADQCRWDGSPGSTDPENPTPQLRPNTVEDESDQRGGYEDYTYIIGYDWIGGAGANLTKRQYTPWSSERTDGDTITAPNCQMFNNAENISREEEWLVDETTVGADGIFKIGEGLLERTFRANAITSPDSSLANPDKRFVTGGFWTQIGLEQRMLTQANSTVPVTCKIYVNSAEGSDYCDANVPITYETVEGFQVTTRAEAGEHGGHAGLAVVLTSERPRDLEIRSRGGRAGRAGGIDLQGANGDRDLICYERDAEDPLHPYIKIYRFNKSVVSVAPSSDGNAGRGGADNAYFGWGVMPDALNWLKQKISDAAEPKEDTSP